MKYEIKIPAVGESISEGTIGQWMKKNGEAVKRNDVLLSLETDKASVEIVAENDGVLNITVPQGQTIAIGSVVGSIDSEGAPAAAAKPAPEAKSAPAKTEAPAQASAPAAAAAAPAPSKEIHPDLKNSLSPAVQKIATEKGLDTASIAGTGRDGRLTKEDVVNAKQSSSPAAPAPSAPAAAKKLEFVGEEKRVPMTTLRKKIAERLVQAQHTAAILTTFNEVDMTKVMELRARYKDKFKEKHGVSLGFMGFFVKASIEALKAVPEANAMLDGNDIVYKNYFNVGVAVGTEKGLIVPVIKHAEKLSIAGIELAIRDFALKARDGKISIDDLNGGTFTISNGGVYGSLMSTPILNPPQSAILGMHKIEDRPVVVDKKIEIRPMMYLAVSYDHRMLDGKGAVSFLVKIKEGIEDPERLLIEV